MNAKKITKKQVMKVLLVIGVVLGAIAFPFVLDFLYGIGMLRWFKNAFSAEVWFSFIGSYFPATIIGLLSLYQAYIIQHQEKQYKELLNQHRFVPAGQATVYRYMRDKNMIDTYSYYDINQMFVRDSRNGLLDNWMSGYIVKSEVYNFSGIGIKEAKVKKIEWEINGKKYCQTNSERMTSITKRVSHSQQQIIIYWIFDQIESVDDIVRCIINDTRHDNRYETSIISAFIQIIDDEGQSCDLKMRLVMRAQGDNYQMSSIEEYYLCGGEVDVIQ